MRILFCDNFIDRKVDPDFQDEHDIALRRGFQVSLISFEDIKASNIARSISRLKTQPEIETAIYRGWMIPPDKYAHLYEALLTKNIKLINNPEEYKNCHYLPESYKWIKDFTPKTNWIPLTGEVDFEKTFRLTAEFKDSPIILKGYVKSQKHNWHEACFIPNASDQERVKNVVLKFIELQGNELNVGLVFRKFEELEFLAHHQKSGMALTKEFRLFFLSGQLIQVLQYWDEGDYGELKPDLKSFSEVGQRISSNFSPWISRRKRMASGSSSKLVMARFLGYRRTQTKIASMNLLWDKGFMSSPRFFFISHNDSGTPFISKLQ